MLRRWKIEESASSPASIASRTAALNSRAIDLFALSENFAKSVLWQLFSRVISGICEHPVV